MILYIDPWTGVAGDMLLAALLDTDREEGCLEALLRQRIAALGLAPDIVQISRQVDHGIEGTVVKVRPEDSPPLRRLSDLLGMLERSDLPPSVRAEAQAALERLAAVEARVHGCPLQEVHFHEVGALDTLVDVVGVLSLVNALQVDFAGVGVVAVGEGKVNIAHGEVGVPAPATLELLKGYSIVGGPEKSELTTPTGALLLGQIGAVSAALPSMRVDRVGYGCGTIKLAHAPNVLRVLLGRRVQDLDDQTPELGSKSLETVVELQSNADDVSGEVVGNACGVLRQAGALDVWTSPVYMKKDRPGVVIHILCRPGSESLLSDVLMRETGVLGVRRHWCQRAVAERGVIEVGVGGEVVTVKWGRRAGRLIAVAAEYESARAAAEATGLPLREVMARAEQVARGRLAPQGDEA